MKIQTEKEALRKALKRKEVQGLTPEEALKRNEERLMTFQAATEQIMAATRQMREARIRVWLERRGGMETEPGDREDKRRMRMKNMELKDTIDLMNSEHYENRFLAEYRQTKIRYERLHRMIIKFHAGTLDFKPTCPVELLEEQAAAMGRYLKIMEIRAEKEGLDLFTLA